jgi:hypothetical protein
MIKMCMLKLQIIVSDLHTGEYYLNLFQKKRQDHL